MAEVYETSKSYTKPIEIQQPIPDAVGPLTLPKNEKGWKRYIKNNIENFEGDTDSAARLMQSYQKGSEYIYNKFNPKFGEFKQPNILIVLNEDAIDSPFGNIDGEDKFMSKNLF